MASLEDQEENVPMDIMEQIEKLSDIFGLNGDKARNYVKTLAPCPVDWTEGLFAIPSVDTLVPRSGFSFQWQYCKALEEVVKRLVDQERLYNYCEKFMSPNHIGMTMEHLEAVNNLSKAQDNSSILIIDAQFRTHYVGDSIQSFHGKRVKCQEKEYGLWAIAMASILLTNPGWISKEKGANIDFGVICPGDVFICEEIGCTHRTPGSLLFLVDEEGLALRPATFGYAKENISVGSFYLR